MSIKTIYIYTDKFQPPHLGKKIIWDLISKRYGIDNCFIAADDSTSPLTFEEKQSIFASMGIDSGNVIKSDQMFSQIKLPSEFNPAEAIVVWITSKENVPLIPKEIQPYNKSPIVGSSYYMTIPPIGSTVSDDQVISFLGKTPMSKDENMVAFKKIFGFFDEYLYNVLTEKFKKNIVVESPDRPKTDKQISFQDAEAVTFIIFDRFVMTGIYTDWHMNLAGALESFAREVDTGKVDLSKNEYVDLDGTIRIKGDLENASVVSKEYSNNKVRSRDLGLVTGRIWPESKVVSIWKYSYKDINKRTFKKLEDFVSLYGDPKHFLYDDASAASEGTASTYEKVTSIVSGEEEPKPSVNINDKFKDVKHVMDPVLKNILKTFDNDTPYNKRAELAHKLGMTVAQLNSLLNIEENH